MPKNTITRLHAAIAAVCPIFGVSVPDSGNSATVRIDFDPAATAQQRTAAQSALNAFDWSEAADTTGAAKFAKQSATEMVDNGALQKGKDFERFCRCVAEVALDAANAERTCFTAMNAAVQAATSLADLKTRFAAISIPPQVTLQQLASAIKTKIAATPE